MNKPLERITNLKRPEIKQIIAKLKSLKNDENMRSHKLAVAREGIDAFFKYNLDKLAIGGELKLAPEGIVNKLQDLLQAEYRQRDLYEAYDYLLLGLSGPAIREHLREHLEAEMDHIQILQRYLVSFGEIPTLSRLPIPPLEELTFEGILNKDLDLELEAVSKYSSFIASLEDSEDFTALKVDMENILIQEEEHKHDLQRWLMEYSDIKQPIEVPQMASVLEEINKVKEAVKHVVLNVDSLDKGIRSQANKLLSKIQEDVNMLGTVIQKYYQDQKTASLLFQEILSKLNESELYRGFSAEEKEKIANAVLLKPDLKVLDEMEFRDVVRSRIRQLSEEDLVKDAYSKTDILMIGRTFAENANEPTQYKVGIEHIKQLIKTPSGFEDATALAIEKTLKDPTRSKNTLFKYYGVSKNKQKEFEEPYKLAAGLR